MGIFRSKPRGRVTPFDFLDARTRNLPTTGNTSASPTAISNESPVIWLDADANQTDLIYQNSLSRFRRLFISFRTFTNTKDCMQFLSANKNETIIITTDQFFEQIEPQLKSMSKIHSIYILSSAAQRNIRANADSTQINGIFTHRESLYSFLKRSITQTKPDSLIMSIIPSIKYSKKDLQQANQLFIYWMLTKQVILENKYDGDALKEFVKFCRAHYSGNPIQTKNIEEFEQNYHRYSPIWWYTKEMFVSELLNRAFQTQDIEIIIRMGFFIKDLHQQLEKVQVDASKTHKLPIVAYRNHHVSNADFEKMKSVKGNLLSFNNFIIADPDYQTTLNLARRAGTGDSGIGIIFRMKVECRLTSSPYAFLENIAASLDKASCVLFSIHSIFRIEGMKRIEDRLWGVDLTLTQANDEQVTSLADLLRHETQEATSWFKLAQLMTHLREHDQARDIHYVLLDLAADSDPLKTAFIYNELGILHDDIGDYASALAFYQKAIDIRQQHLPPNHRSLSISYNNMGEVQRQMGDYFSALSTHQKTLDIKQKALPANDRSLATTYNNIGLTNELLGEFPTALKFYQKALDIKRKSLPADHLELATTYNNIGELQRAMGNFPAALTSLEKALHIRLKHVPPMDPSLATIYNNIGLIHEELGDFPKAVSYLQKSLDVKLKSLPTDHPSLAFSYNNIGSIHQVMGHFSQALSSFQMALGIQEKALAPDHPDVAVTFTNIGVSYQAIAGYAQARSYYEKAVQIRQKAFPPNHPLLGVSYNNLGHLHQLMGEYRTALEYYERTLKLQKKTLTEHHPALAATYNNLADVHRRLEDHNKALLLYKKSLDIKKKSLTAHHPALVITYNNMGSVHQALKNYPAALDCYKQTMEIQQKTLPSDHPDLAAVYNNIGVSHQSMKEYSTALDYYKKALTIQNCGLPPTHPDIATTYNSIASVLVCLEDYPGALEHAKRAVDIASQSLPPDHPHLVTFRDYYERINIKVQSMKKEQ